nr:hypothetical protein [Tanacetum cinerariifolium]
SYRNRSYCITATEFAYWVPNIESTEDKSITDSLKRKDDEGPSLDGGPEHEEPLDVDNFDSVLSKDDNNDSDSSSEILFKNVTEKCGVVNNNMSNNVKGEILEDHFDGDRRNDNIEDNTDINPSTNVYLDVNQNTSILEVVEDLSSLDRSSDKAERLAHHNNSLDDLDISLRNRLLHRDKCRVRPVKAVVNDSIIVSSSTSPGTVLNLAKESCSTWLDYVGPLITDELDSEKRWSYKDPDGNVQWSFSLAQLWFYLFSSSIMNSGRSKEDHVIGISKLVFVTNFPDYFKSRDLWSLCEAYGKVVDVFIPNRKSKAGKHFAFVRFIRVDDHDMDRLISNLCTLWVGLLHLHANVVHYERSSKPSSSSRPPTVKVHAIPPPTRHFPSSFVTVVNDNHSFPVLNTPGPPDLVLDDCVHEEDMSRCVIGEVVDIEESVGSSFARKRICVKTSRVDNILETFKVVFKGKIFTVRAKELFTWTLSFLEYKEEGYISEEESALGDHNIMADSLQGHGGKGRRRESEDEGKPMNVRDNDLDPSLSHPPGFTPATSQQENFDPSLAQQKVNRDESLHKETPFLKSKSKKNHHANESHTIDSSSEASTCVHSRTTLKGGSFLDVLDDMIKFEQSMGFKTKKEWVKELNNKYGVNFLALQETKMDCISHLDVKFMWGNPNYQFVASDSVGSSGLINRWNGETIVLGDFNEFGGREDGRVLIHMVHPSAKKMSKLDRFLVSEGIILGFPAITAVCLDRHFLDHRPILLNEIHTDFGHTPFRTYHSWFSREGLDAMVEHEWCSFTRNDSNRLIRFKKKLQDLKSIIRGWFRDSNSSL